MPVHSTSNERFFRKPPLLLTLLLVALAAGVALIFWTLPNWGSFSQNVTQFPVLWQEESNRMTIVLLTVKAFSWLILAALVAGWCWLVYSFWCWLAPRHATPPVSSQAPIGTSLHKTAVIDPITPIPPTLPFSLEQAAAPAGIQFLQQSDQTMQATFPSMPPFEQPQQAPLEEVYVTIYLLQDVQMVLHAPGQESRSTVVDLKSHVKRLLLLAYIAHAQGKPVERDKMLRAVFLPGRTGAEAEIDKLVSAFRDQVKAIRMALQEARSQLNQELGREVIPPNLDVFSHDESMLWWLDPRCRVADLAAVEAHHQRIEQAEREGRLAGCVPEDVNAACQALIKGYRGDFLSALIALHPREFEPRDNRSSWVRSPFTLYRTHFLQALWYTSNYDLAAGQQLLPVHGNEAQAQRLAHIERAARTYSEYAMYACNSRFDAAVLGKSESSPTARVGMSECALRYSLLLWSALGNPHRVDQVYAEYEKQMKRILGSEWQASPETTRDLSIAREGKGAYRLPLAVVPHGPYPYNLTPTG